MRQHALKTWVAVLVLAASPLARAQAPDCTPGNLACSPTNAPGQVGYDDSVSDLTYSPGSNEVWALEGSLPGFNNLVRSRVTVFNEGLQTFTGVRDVNFTETVYGIGEIPQPQPFAGNFLVITPGVFTGPNRIRIEPRIGIMDRQLSLIADPAGAFRPLDLGGQNPGFISSLDAHPTEQEIAVLNDGRATVLGAPPGPHILFLDYQYRLLRGPFRIEGSTTAFGGGIAYNSPDTVLVVAQFRTAFEGRLAMEYNRQSGLYTGRTVLFPVDPAVPPPISVGLDTGFIGGEPALFLYDAFRDRIFATPSAHVDAPGPVQGLNPACVLEADGRARLTWTNSPNFSYEEILILENGVLVATLPSSATEYRSSSPVSGKYEFCVETRSAGGRNEIRVCCEGQSGKKLTFLAAQDPTVVQVDVDPLPGAPHLLMGMACPPVVARKEDFRQFVIGSYDNQVRVLDYRGQLVPGETIITEPGRQSLVQNNRIMNFAASGIALLDIVQQGQTIPLYALLDIDGLLGDFNPSASFHLLRDTVLPGQAAPTRAGTRFRSEIPLIDFSALDQGFGRLLVDWDTDRQGDLVALDSEGQRLIKLRYVPEQDAVRALFDAPLPMRDLTPFVARRFPMGAVSVLPNGMYLVAGGDTFDVTVNRVFLVTPMEAAGVGGRMVGQVEGLMSYSQFFSTAAIGRAMGPDISYGLETAFFEDEGALQEGVGAVYYNFLSYFPSENRGFAGNVLAGLTSSTVHPDLAGEQILDRGETVGLLAPLVTEALRPSFAAQAPKIDFHYHLFNPSEQDDLRLRLAVLLDNAEVQQLGEADLVIPAGRSVYRSAQARPEKSIALRIENRGTVPQAVRILVGATGLVGVVPQITFRRGDVNADAKFNVTDIVNLLGALFLGQPDLIVCQDASDVDDDGRVNNTDVVYSISYQFLAGVAPPPPGDLACGPDPTDDAAQTDLGCATPCP